MTSRHDAGRRTRRRRAITHPDCVVGLVGQATLWTVDGMRVNRPVLPRWRRIFDRHQHQPTNGFVICDGQRYHCPHLGKQDIPIKGLGNRHGTLCTPLLVHKRVKYDRLKSYATFGAERHVEL